MTSRNAGRLAALLLVPVCAAYMAFSARAPAPETYYALDGDSLKAGERHMRLWGIDAPEREQQCNKNGAPYPCGREAQQALAARVQNGGVTCVRIDIDTFGRDVAQCRAGGRDLAEAQVRAGWALDYTYYSKGFYKPAEREAKAAGSGIWQGTFDEPRQWRKDHPRE